MFSLVSASDPSKVFAYGMEIAQETRTDAIVYRRDPDTGRTMVGQHSTAEDALKRYGKRVPLVLRWEYDEDDC
ncbi:hypothetical protein [Saccharothrix coeruleofusca]|uniref:hypothetical protein n=1 Tax=Saccharothrix coeruleofusca TaxID=33919 RepID=UPI00166FB437|nr:hypothetical protein [Saccharothrix coeruleofusca]MBP2340062.1 hypothetical protein [Saccharothrix coeruleofusca]